DWNTFRKCLAWDGLGLDAARQALQPLRWPDGVAVPAWADMLREVLNRAADGVADGTADGPAARERFLEVASPVPFEQLLTPFVQVARQRLAARAGAASDHLTEAAHATLERALLTILADMAARPLHLELSIQRAQQPGLDRLAGGF